jgi:hypothetical protein
MADRSWFYASEGEQQGPFSETRFRELIAEGMVGSDTLVWANGMSEWVRAGDVPGLLRDSAQRERSAARLNPSFAADGVPEDARSGDGVHGLELTLGRLFRIYWTFIWRSLLGSLVVGFALGFVAGFLLGLFGAKGHIPAVSGGLGAIGGAVWSFFCLKMALARRYRDFRIILVPH